MSKRKKENFVAAAIFPKSREFFFQSEKKAPSHKPRPGRVTPPSISLSRILPLSPNLPFPFPGVEPYRVDVVEPRGSVRVVRGPAAVERRGRGAVGERRRRQHADAAEPARRCPARDVVGVSSSCDEHPPVHRVPSRALLLACVFVFDSFARCGKGIRDRKVRARRSRGRRRRGKKKSERAPATPSSTKETTDTNKKNWAFPAAGKAPLGKTPRFSYPR